MGTMIQRHGLTEADYRGERFRNSSRDLKGCHDLLCLTRADVIAEIHRAYLEAGADIITTNSFNANAVSLADYGLEDLAYEIAFQSARIARAEADDFMERHPGVEKFVAGTMGPTNKTASMSADIMDPGAREVTFDDLSRAYYDQAKGLLDGGADMLLVETVFDTLNCKAALFAVGRLEEERGERIPVMVSATISDAAGRTLSGQTLEAFLTSVAHADLLSVGLNCAFGPDQIEPYLRRLSDLAPRFVSCHPNAGLPNALGEYDETPESFAQKTGRFLDRRLVNIIGGCCGTTPEHMARLAEIVGKAAPREIPPAAERLEISNLENLVIDSRANFINIGERTNVAGSARFARLIREGDYAEAVNVALRQIEAGAQVIDICMDAPMIDAPEAMRTFLRLIASEPEIARVPLMIDSSEWDVVKAGLESCQGKCIVNSISLKEGEEKFLAKAREIRRYGAAVVVMLFDEEGQADTFEKKIRVAERSYRLLTSHGFPARDIIFDPNILTIGTGMAEHDSYAVDFIRAVRWIKENLPHVHVSGGVSNLSFAFRGNNPLREAIHSVFLYHAVAAGLDMAIVNSQMLRVYEEIEPGLLERVEDLVLNRRPDATERLIEYASSAVTPDAKDAVKETEGSPLSPKERIERKLLRGVSDGIEDDLAALLAEKKDALRIIEETLMPVMEKIGRLFGEGKMFLPQVIKSARVLKQSIGFLAPSISSEADARSLGKIGIATVRGDIHDIGKNIVALVVGCNGFDVTDLGVMAEACDIADFAQKERPVAILLSGLITPSLAEMIEVCRELERRRLKVPVIVGGATTSALHTALKIAPEYSGPVFHSSDASQNNRILAGLISENKEEFIAEHKLQQQRLRSGYDVNLAPVRILPLEEARSRAEKTPHATTESPNPQTIVLTDFPIESVESLIDWPFFFAGWGFKGKWPEILEDARYGDEVRSLFEEAVSVLERIKREKRLTLNAVLGIFKAVGKEEDIIVSTQKGDVILPMLRSQSSDKNGECAADFVPTENGRIGLFALTAGLGLREFMDELKREGDDYKAIIAKLLADRLAEAFAVRLNELYPGCRLAFGYPAVPDHTLKRDVFDILDAGRVTGMRLVGNAMISPEESVCGLIIPDGRYFNLGRIGDDQLEIYAGKRRITIEQLRALLPPLLLDR